MAEHSSLIGGSTAGRRLKCPGSFQAERALPPSSNVPSPYADEGTFGHAVMEKVAHHRKQYPDNSMYDFARSLLGQHIYDRKLTQTYLDDMIFPAIGMLEDLEHEYGGYFTVIGVEERVQFPGLIGAYGTVDLILTNGTYVIFADYKFGQGVPVYIVVDDTLNAQIAFYIAAALHTLKRKKLKRLKIVGAIIQPRIDGGLTHTEIAPIELDHFIEDVHNAIDIAINRDPPLHRGDHCRWCPAKVCCSKWTGPALDLSALGIVPKPVTVSAEPTPYALYLAKAKMLIDGLLLMQKDINEQIVSYLEDGGAVPGWKLKAKTTNRKWVDETVVEPALRALGFDDSEIWQRKLQTFTVADAAAKRRGVKIPSHLRIAPPTTETTLAAADDPAPSVEHKDLVVEFRNALKALTGNS